MSAPPAHPRQRWHMRNLLEIGQRWRRKSDGAVVVIAQIYRADRQVIVRAETENRHWLRSFTEMRCDYELLVAVPAR